MKKNRFLLVIVALFTLYNCKQDQETETSSGKTKISFSLSSSDAVNGRKQTSGIQNVTAVIISITTPTGENVMTYQHVNLISFGDDFITEPVELVAGHYTLTDFFLVGDSSKILYATPHKGSFLGALPKQPLDRNFSVAWGKVNTMAMEVVEVEGFTPEDFGYKSFSISALKFFPLAVKVDKQGKLVFATAEAWLLQGLDTVAAYQIGTSPKLIKFSGTPDSEYDLVIIKDGFARYTKHFKLKELLSELNHKPLTVTLNPALTFWINFSEEGGYYSQFALTSVGSANWTVDWGDGKIEHVAADLSQGDGIEGQGDLNHVYYAAGGLVFFISVTGDFDKTTGFTSIGFGNSFLLKLGALPNLIDINLFQDGPSDELDLRQNSKLERLLLYSSPSVLLPQSNNIKSIKDFSAPNSLDHIIYNVYANAVRNGTQGGTIDFSTDAYGGGEEGAIAIPTKSSKIKLKALRDIYHWRVFPFLETL